MTLDPNAGTNMLASVVNADEALACVDAGVDVIDCKDPGSGALGALAYEEIQEIVDVVAGRAPVSATIGDIACAGQGADRAIIQTAQTGVDFVKVGMFEDLSSTGRGYERLRCAIERFGGLEVGQTRLVAVLLADQGYDLSLVELLSRAGFAGVMLDTADKSCGCLCDVLGSPALDDFVGRAKACGLFSGLAGRLRLEHIQPVLSHKPDIIGFRGALCVGGARGAGIDADALREVRRAIAVARDGVARVIGRGETEMGVCDSRVAALN